MRPPLIPAQDVIDVADALRKIQARDGEVRANEQLAVEVTDSGISIVAIDDGGWRAGGYGTRRFIPVQEVNRG